MDWESGRGHRGWRFHHEGVPVEWYSAPSPYHVPVLCWDYHPRLVGNRSIVESRNEYAA